MVSVPKELHVALIVFVNNEGMILLNRRADASSEMWECIGGGIEEGESALDAIKREVREEVGYNLDERVDALTHLNTFEYENGMTRATVYAFEASYPGVEKFSDSDETYVRDLKLFTVDNALHLVLLPMTRMILTSF